MPGAYGYVVGTLRAETLEAESWSLAAWDGNVEFGARGQGHVHHCSCSVVVCVAVLTWCVRADPSASVEVDRCTACSLLRFACQGVWRGRVAAATAASAALQAYLARS